jgi:hypothetical protein
MNTSRFPACLALTLVIAGCIFANRGETAEPETNPSPSARPTDVIATIGEFDIPYLWFLHEFRSNFYRHPDQNQARQVIFDTFMERMKLLALARAEGIHQREEVRTAIDERIANMRSYMDYQLAMTEAGLLIEAYLKHLGLNQEDVEVDDNDIAAFYYSQRAAMPGAPPSIEDVPPEIRARIAEQAALAKFKTAVDQATAAQASNLVLHINQSLVDHVPLPEQRGR